MVPALPPLLRIPREIRDIIHDYVALGEETYHYDKLVSSWLHVPYRLVTHATGGRPVTRIVTRAGLDRARSQLRRESSDTVGQLATTPFQSSPFSVWTETCNATNVNGYNCNFEGLIASLRGVTPQCLASSANPLKLRVRMVFTSLANTKRAGLLAWLDACGQLGVRATYHVPPCGGTRTSATEGRIYVNIYDLFGMKHATDESEDERLFRALRGWYAL